MTYRADETDPWEYCWVGFNGAEANIMIAKTPFSSENPVVRFSTPDAIQNAILDIYRASGITPASELRTIGQLYLFLALLVEQTDAKNASNDPSLEYVENAIRFISHNYSSGIDVSDIASSAGISRSHLYRIFMRHIGTSPNEYLSRFRVSRACELIEHSSLPISAVAASVGYEDQLYFSRVFKKITSRPPSAFVKECHAKNAGPDSPPAKGK